MYIHAVPQTPQNQSYVEQQKEAFLAGWCPLDMPQGKSDDFPQGKGEDQYIGFGTLDDISEVGQRAMGFPVVV